MKTNNLPSNRIAWRLLNELSIGKDISLRLDFMPQFIRNSGAKAIWTRYLKYYFGNFQGTIKWQQSLWLMMTGTY